jgi:hypothetical protein
VAKECVGGRDVVFNIASSLISPTGGFDGREYFCNRR